MNNTIKRIYSKFKCPREGSLRLEDEVLRCEACGKIIAANGNIVRFIGDDEKRPYWAKQLDTYYPDGTIPDVKERYYSFGGYVSRLPQAEGFITFALGAGNTIVDLASGPSGYFAPLLERLKPSQLFIGTDACCAVLNAHAAANSENEQFLMLDIDLDKPLPFRTSSIDVFTGFLTSNVIGYGALLSEVARCLKPGGRLVVAEIFYEKGCVTWQYLKNESAVNAAFEDYVSYCENIGLTYRGSELVKAIVGKLDPEDLYPLDDADKSEIRTVYFEK